MGRKFTHPVLTFYIISDAHVRRLLFQSWQCQHDLASLVFRLASLVVNFCGVQWTAQSISQPRKTYVADALFLCGSRASCSDKWSIWIPSLNRPRIAHVVSVIFICIRTFNQQHPAYWQRDRQTDRRGDESVTTWLVIYKSAHRRRTWRSCLLERYESKSNALDCIDHVTSHHVTWLHDVVTSSTSPAATAGRMGGQRISLLRDWDPPQFQDSRISDVKARCRLCTQSRRHGA